MRFKNRTAIVTGAGHGIGRAIAERVASDGARVLVCDINPERAATVALAINDAGGLAEALEVDVSRRAEAERAVARVAELWGQIDQLVNNAGLMRRAPFLETTDEHWDSLMAVNLRGVFLMSQVVARQMVSQGAGGCIVNVASNSGLFGGRGRAVYGASKAGVVNLTQCMAIELAEHGIRVNAVAPGPTLTRPELQGDLMASAASRMPLARYGQPAEIAAVAAFLLSDDASFVTGHTYPADGGFTIAGVMEG